MCIIKHTILIKSQFWLFKILWISLPITYFTRYSTTYGIFSITCEALTQNISFESISPQYPWIYADTIVALKGSYPYPIKEAIIPVRVSPIPPEAILLLPVEFT